MTNCPNCNAPVRGAVCDYCGTVLREEHRVIHGDCPYFKIDIGDFVIHGRFAFKEVSTTARIGCVEQMVELAAVGEVKWEEVPFGRRKR